MKNYFGANVKRLRLAKGLTQGELAELCGYMHKTSIQKIEAGKSDVATSKAEIIANVLGADAVEMTIIPVVTPDPMDEYIEAIKRLLKHVKEHPEDDYKIKALRDNLGLPQLEDEKKIKSELAI